MGFPFANQGQRSFIDHNVACVPNTRYEGSTVSIRQFHAGHVGQRVDCRAAGRFPVREIVAVVIVMLIVTVVGVDEILGHEIFRRDKGESTRSPAANATELADVTAIERVAARLTLT